jgi:hypothetical protein
MCSSVKTLQPALDHHGASIVKVSRETRFVSDFLLNLGTFLPDEVGVAW